MCRDDPSLTVTDEDGGLVLRGAGELHLEVACDRLRSDFGVEASLSRPRVALRESVEQEEAKRLLHHHRIEKLLVVDGEGRCVGLITVKDIEKSQLNPHAAKDAQGRLRVAAAMAV